MQVGGCGDWRAPVQQVWFNVECPLQECVCVCARDRLVPFFSERFGVFFVLPRYTSFLADLCRTAVPLKSPTLHFCAHQPAFTAHQIRLQWLMLSQTKACRHNRCCIP